MSRPPRPLSQTLLVPLCALVVLIAAVSGIVRIGAVERGYHETMIVGADQLSRGLASATWHAMLADDRQAAYDTMQVVARQPGISRIRIFNKEGRVMFSTAPEAGRLVDKNAEACVLCHASAQPLVRVETPSRARVFSDPAGQRRLAMITPIYNEPSCSNAACHAHPARQSVLGVLDVALDLGPADRLIVAARRRVMVTIAIEVVADRRLPGRLRRVLRDAPDPQAGRGQRRARPHGARAPDRDHVQPRAVEPLELVQPDAGPAARGAVRDQPRRAGARSQGGRAHGPAAAGAETPAAGRPPGVARPARRERRARDQQPALRRPQLLGADEPHPDGRRDPQGARARVPRLPGQGLRADRARGAHRLRPARLLAAFEAAARPVRPQRHRAHHRRRWCRTSSSC